MYTLSLALLALFCIYIGISAFSSWDASWLLELDTAPVRVLYVLVFAVFICAALILIRRALKRLSDRGLRRVAFICILIAAAGQLIFLSVIEPSLRYDPLKVFDMAIEMLETHTISGTYESGYFARYTNNYPLTILTYLLFRFLRALGVAQSSFMRVVQLINTASITASVWLGYLIVKRLKGRLSAVFYLCVCVICPLTYVWAGYYYTATVSMPFLMAILYLWIRLKQDCAANHGVLWKCVLTCALLGFVTVFGYKVRATAAIAFIAVVIDAVLTLIHARGAARKTAVTPEGEPTPVSHILPSSPRDLFKKYAACTASFLLAALITLGLFSAAVDTYVDFDYENTGFPAVHWIMMGARWDGAYDMTDENYTSSFDTKEEKVAADLEVLKERIVEAGPWGLVTLAGRKLLNTWVDGTDDFMTENSSASYTKVYDWLLGDKSCYITIYSQAFRALQMLIIGVGAVFALIFLRKRHEYPGLFLIQLTLLGGMAFHLIWETNSLYSISFTFLGLILLSDGISSLEERLAADERLNVCRFVPAAALAAFAVLMVVSEYQLVETPIEAYDYSVNQYQYAGTSEGIVTSYDQVYVQTFTAEKPFNRISILGINDVGGYNQSAFCVKLTDEYGNVIYDSHFATGLLVSLRDYEIELPEVVPDGPTLYTLEISPGYFQDEDSLELLTYDTGNWDIYADGTLTVADEERENADLVFAVYEYEVTTYFSIRQYVVICAGMLLVASGITAAAWFSWKPRVR